MKVVQKGLVALCRMLLASIFWFSIRFGTSLTIRGVQWDTGAPRTYLGMMHKRDIDPFILVPTIVFHRGWRGLAGDVRFALRGDGFTRGFVARMVGRANWLARLLRPLSVGSILRWLGAYPTESLQRPAEEWIREVIRVDGDVLAKSILAPAFIEEFARQTGDSAEQVRAQPLTRLLVWRNYTALQKFYGPEMLLSTRRRHIERRVVARVHAWLNDISSCLWQDGTFFGSPEGQLSPDGRISPLHAGFGRIILAAPPDLCIVPIALTYDFMTTGRCHAFVDFSPALEYAPKLPPAELAVRLRRSWLLHAHFTCTQLASGFLMQARENGRMEFTLAEMAFALVQQACTLDGAGRAVDPRLLHLSHATKRARGYLAYLEKRGLLTRLAPSRWRIAFDELTMHVGPREVAYNDMPLLYAYNELQDMLSVS